MNGGRVKEIRRKVRQESNNLVTTFLRDCEKLPVMMRIKLALRLVFHLKYYHRVNAKRKV
jgi:hypothetical protein